MRFLDLGHQDINQSVLDLAAAARIFQGENSPKFLTDMWTSRFRGDPRITSASMPSNTPAIFMRNTWDRPACQPSNVTTPSARV
jgi:hypothetical protein